MENLIKESADNKAVVDSLYQAFSKGDVPGVLRTMDSQIVWNEAEGNEYAKGNPYVGPDAVLNGVFGPILQDHEYFNLKDIEIHEMLHGKVLATLRYDAKYKSGKAYNAQVAHFWTVKNGKITGFQQYVDTKKLHEASIA
ncbi:nuclear transport factor 2 family protein [Algoriphagus formosus]|uniref:nuclear transport factor 2 family protein n=1 Tax=Algoriphagus formosus TaxID=2007308 RepID=UPI003F6F0FA6